MLLAGWSALLANALFTAPGAALANFLHTAGALAYIGGVIAWVAWSRGLHKGQHNVNTLALGASLSYVGIAANLFGGFVRTYQPGHASLTQVFSDPWVFMMVVKHVALFAGIAAAVYLFEMVAPRMRAAWKAGTLEPTQKPGRVAAAIVLSSIFIAAILGGVTAALPGAAAIDQEPDMPDPVDTPTLFQTQTYFASGSATSGAPPSVGEFDVALGATQLEAYLYTSAIPLVGSPSVYELRLISPSGAVFTGVTDPTSHDPTAAEINSDVVVNVKGPEIGRWSYEVRATAGVAANWELAITVTGPEGLELTKVIQFTGGFYEINTVMQEGADMNWDWSVEGGESDFNVHQHVAGQTVYPVRGTYSENNGTYIAEEDGGVSIMWENAGNEPITLTFRVWGNFTLHSVFDETN